MNKLILPFLLLFSIMSFGQSTEFTKVFKDDSTDQARSMFQTSAGDYYMLSSTNSYGQGDEDIQITKTNGLGEITWSYTYGTSGTDIGYKIKPTLDGGAIVAGHSDGFGSAEDAFMLKINSSGTVLWSKAIRTDSAEIAYDIMQARNGDIFATGFIDIDSLNKNIFLIRISNTGTVSWVKTYGGSGNEVGYALTEDRNGRIVIVGSTDYDTVNIGSTGDVDIKMVVTNAGGAIIGSKNIGTSSNDYANSVIATSNYKYIVGGNTQGGSGLGQDMFYAEIDTNLNVNNATWIGTVDADSAQDMFYETNGTLTLAMSSPTLNSSKDILLVQTSLSGGVAISNVFGGTSTDGNSQVAIAKVNSAGYSIYGSGHSLISGSDENLYLLKLQNELNNSCIGTNDLVNTGGVNFSTNSHSNLYNYGQGSSVTFSRNTNSNKDTTLCCELEVRIASDSITICDNDVVNLGKSSISGYTYSWSAIGSSWTSSSSNPQVSPSTTTIYKLVVSSDEEACSSDSGYIKIRVNSRQTITPINDTFFCANDSVIISAASGMLSYTWQGNTLLANGSSIKLKVSDTVALTMIDANSCIYTDTIGVELKDLPMFSLGNDTTICENLSITLAGPSGMVNYKWNGSNSTSSTYTTNNSQVHTLDVEDMFGCEYSDQIQILTNPASTFSLGNDTSFCEGSSYTVFGPTSLSGFIWNDTASSSASLTVTNGGTFWLEAYNSFDCPAYDTITVSEIAAPMFSLGNDTGFCDNVNYLLQGPAGLDSYLWFNGSTKDTFRATGSGTYYLMVTDDNNCTYTDSIDIDEYTSPTITLGPDTAIRNNISIVLSPGTGFAKYAWNTGETTQAITVSDSGVYYVTVTDDNGCTASDTVKVRDLSSIKYINGVKYTMFPNPATSVLFFETEGNMVNSRLELMDMQGKIVYSEIVQFNKVQINVSELSSGMYHLMLNGDNISLNFKVMIDHQ
jgi:hypothetical protein